MADRKFADCVGQGKFELSSSMTQPLNTKSAILNLQRYFEAAETEDCGTVEETYRCLSRKRVENYCRVAQVVMRQVTMSSRFQTLRFVETTITWKVYRTFLFTHVFHHFHRPFMQLNE